MEELRIIRDKSQLEGTCYFEILPGIYEGKCWGAESIYFEEEAFGFLEKIIESVVPEFDHFAFTEIEKEKWVTIIEKFRQLSSKLQSAKLPNEVEEGLCFFCKNTQQEFESQFDSNKKLLSEMINEFCSWLKAQLESSKCVSVLGL